MNCFSCLISVIVPVYKVEKYLDRCVQSIVDQTYTNLEIILVDDGSPDNSGALCDAWAEKDNRIKVIHKENGGLSDARNVGIAVAAGECIAFVDSDDWVSPLLYETLYKCIVENDCDLAECRFVMTHGSADTPELSGRVTVCSTEEAMNYHLQNRMFQQIVWNKLYRHEIVSVAFEKGKSHEDEFWTYQIISNSKKLAHIDTRLYYYFQRDNSIMGRPYSLNRLHVLEAKYQRFLHLKQHYPDLSQECGIELLWLCIYHGQCVLRMLGDEETETAFSTITKITDSLFGEIQEAEFTELRMTHKCWMLLARKDILITCKLRNMLKIGF